MDIYRIENDHLLFEFEGVTYGCSLKETEEAVSLQEQHEEEIELHWLLLMGFTLIMGSNFIILGQTLISNDDIPLWTAWPLVLGTVLLLVYDRFCKPPGKKERALAFVTPFIEIEQKLRATGQAITYNETALKVTRRALHAQRQVNETLPSPLSTSIRQDKQLSEQALLMAERLEHQSLQLEEAIQQACQIKERLLVERRLLHSQQVLQMKEFHYDSPLEAEYLLCDLPVPLRETVLSHQIKHGA